MRGDPQAQYSQLRIKMQDLFRLFCALVLEAIEYN